jgi:hypothetical protein
VPSGATSVKVELGLPGIVGKAWFDDVALDLLDASGKRMTPDHKTTGKTDTSDWYAFQTPKEKDGVTIDLSFLNEMPAGRHGPVVVKSGHFAFKDGTPARFWGTDFAGPNAFPTHEVATATARRLARLGANLVRLHHMDAPWAKPNIFDPNSDDTAHFGDGLDRVEFFIAELKKNGVYVYPDLLVHRKFRAGDKVPDYDKLEPGAKGVVHFSKVIIEKNEAYAKALLSHKNKYTGMTLAEDPVMIGTEVVNESSIFTGFSAQAFPPAFDAELEGLWKAGHAGKLTQFGFDYGAQGLLPQVSPESASESLRFLAGLEDDSNARMKAALASIQAHTLLTGSNIGLPVLAEIRANARMDFMDTHFYWDHPQIWKTAAGWADIDHAPFDNRAMLRDPAAAAPRHVAEWSVKDRPLIVTEWNDCFPNEQRLEGPIMMAAYGSLQAWDGMLQFASGHDLPGAVKMAPFDIDTRPDNEPLFQAGALLYRRAYLAASDKEIVVDVDDKAVFSPPSRSELLFQEPWLPYAARVAKRFVGSDAPAPVSLDAVRSLHDADKKTIRASTGQLRWDYGASVLRIDAPKVQGFAGAIGTGRALETTDVSFALDARNPWAAVLLVSLDDLPIASSKRMLVVAVARAENTGQIFNAAHTALKEAGTVPVLMQGVKAKLTLKGAAVTVKPLDPSGRGAAAIAQSGGTFALSPKDKTSMYVVER